MLVYMLGSVFNWDTLAFVSAIFPITSIFLTFIIPESPTWLMSKRKETLCRTSLRRLRDSKCDVDAEVNNLVLFFKTNESTSIQEKFQLIYQPSTYKPFVILSLYFLLSQFSGFVVITCYAVEIIKVLLLKKKKNCFMFNYSNADIFFCRIQVQTLTITQSL